MIILGIETSCDETAAAVLTNDNNRITILSNVVASSASLQAKYGGIIPEQAAREQIKSIIPVIEEALSLAFSPVIPLKKGIHTDNYLWIPGQAWDDIIKKVDAIAITYGPGLIGSLLVGVETAKVLATVWKKPLIPVNHLIGHFYANWISQLSAISYQLSDKKQNKSDDRRLTTDSYRPTFPCIGLLVSGGHTDLVIFESHGKYKYLGGTRDDAAGECFDKCARLLGLPYPGGPEISRLAEKGAPKAFNLPRPMINSKDFDFSFSGLKTAVSNLLRETPSVIPANAGIHLTTSGSELDPRLRGDDKKRIADLAASIEQAIVDVLIAKAIRAAQTHHIDQIMIAGGVAANQELVRNLKFKIKNLKLKTKLFVPPAHLCTDNAAMIASSAFFQKPIKNPLDLQANPNLAL